MKFHEVYLGEAGAETSEFQDGGGSPQGGTGAGGGHLSLEQYICNAREALGVESHYSRCDSGLILKARWQENDHNNDENYLFARFLYI